VKTETYFPLVKTETEVNAPKNLLEFQHLHISTSEN